MNYSVSTHILWLIFFCLLIAIFSLFRNLMPFNWYNISQLLNGTASNQINLILLDWRLPRIIIALFIGAALGISGAIFQSLMQNPLGSPDILGFNTGAYTGVLITLVFFKYNIHLITIAALLGGIVSSMLVYLLSWNNGINNLRIIIIGISVKLMLMALNSWLIINTSTDISLSASLWNAGSLSGITWNKVYPIISILFVTFIIVLMLSKRLFLLELGNDIALSIGISVEKTRVCLILTSVILTAASTSLVGPISFVALLAPQIARHLNKGSRLSNISGFCLVGLCGSCLLMISDAIAQYLFLPYQLPVGIITITLGGLYLIILLFRQLKYL